MKITCNTKNLQQTLSSVAGVVPSKPEPLVLGNILLEADEEQQQLSLTAFDGTLGLRSQITAQVTENFAATLPAKMFKDIVGKLREPEVVLQEVKGVQVLLKSGTSKFKLGYGAAEDFPSLPIVEPQSRTALELPAQAIADGLKGSLFAAATDTTKRILTGVSLSLETDSQELELAATDSHRLAVRRIALPEGVQSESVSNLVIPARALAVLPGLINKLKEPKKGSCFNNVPIRFLLFVLEINCLVGILFLRKPQTQVSLIYHETQVTILLANHLLTSSLLNGAYPPYQRLLPQEFTRRATCPRKQLITSLELISTIATNDIVQISLEEDLIRLVMEGRESDRASQELPAQVAGEPLSIGLNYKYLIAGLKAIASEEVILKFNEALQPVVICHSFEPKSMEYLLMPIQIRS